jgi:hypothetical protein
LLTVVNDRNSATPVFRSKNYKTLLDRKEKWLQTNNRVILVTEWNQKCNEKLHIPFSTIGVIMVTTPCFCVLVGS